MSTPSQPGKSKIAGLALLGVAAVALVLGVVTVSGGFSGGTDNTASSSEQHKKHDKQPHGSKQPGGKQRPSSTASNRPSDSKQPGASKGHPSAKKHTTVIQPPDKKQDKKQDKQHKRRSGKHDRKAGTHAAASKTAPVRVYNNSTVHGLADRAADRLRKAGFKVVSVGNYPGGVIPTTTAYYRPGKHEKDTAQSVAKKIGAKSEPRFAGLKKASPGVILVVTKDYKA